MPTERFMRLPEAKKLGIWKAAFDEFSRTTLDKISINRIIRAAGISRGSFYTYFEDKWDLLNYLLGTMQREIMKSAADSSESGMVNFWDWMNGRLSGLLDFFRKPENMEFIRNFCRSLGTADILLKGERFSTEYFYGAEKEFTRGFYEVYLRGVKGGELIPLTDEELKKFQDFCRFSMGIAVSDTIAGKAEEKVKEDFAIRMNFLRRSVESERGENA
jgi:AcrR family transcriptional regulator